MIPSSALSSVSAYIPAPTLSSSIDYVVDKVKKHSGWCETQLHLLKKSPNLSAHRATGEKLYQQQSAFITCDRCNNLNCFSMKLR